MPKIYMAELRALLDQTALFIKVFGSNEYFKIPNWLAEICDPENIRHSKLSAFVKPETPDYHDKRMFWGDKGPTTGFKYKRPDEPAVHDPLLRGKMTFYPDPAVQGEADTEEARRLRAEEIKREYENLSIRQVKYNPLTSQIKVVPTRLVRGMPRRGEHYAKKQPMSLLPRHCRTEFYHRALVTAELSFHVGFLFDKKTCDLKKEKYFFAFDAWTWAQWWVLPQEYARWNRQFIPVLERRFLPNFRNPEFVRQERDTVLRSADIIAAQIDVTIEGELPPPILAPTPRGLPPPILAPTPRGLPPPIMAPTPRDSTPQITITSPPSSGPAPSISSGSPSISPPSRRTRRPPTLRYARWNPAIPLVMEGRPGAAANPAVAHRAAYENIEALRAEMAHALSIPPTTAARISVESGRTNTISPRDKGYHLIFQSLGYAGLRDLINDIHSYVHYFIAAFHNPVNPEVNEFVNNIALKMLQLERILLHNEVLIAPAPDSIVGICLIPSRPLPENFSLESFRTPGTNAFKSFQEAVKHQSALSRLGGNIVPITLLDTFSGKLELLEEIIEEVEFPDVQAPVHGSAEYFPGHEPPQPASSRVFPPHYRPSRYDPPEAFPALGPPLQSRPPAVGQQQPPYPDCAECRKARSRSGGNINALCIYHRGLQSRQEPPPRRW